MFLKEISMALKRFCFFHF